MDSLLERSHGLSSAGVGRKDCLLRAVLPPPRKTNEDHPIRSDHEQDLCVLPESRNACPDEDGPEQCLALESYVYQDQSNGGLLENALPLSPILLSPHVRPSRKYLHYLPSHHVLQAESKDGTFYGRQDRPDLSMDGSRQRSP